MVSKRIGAVAAIDVIGWLSLGGGRNADPFIVQVKLFLSDFKKCNFYKKVRLFVWL